jgi:hypothetical protein
VSFTNAEIDRLEARIRALERHRDALRIGALERHRDALYERDNDLARTIKVPPEYRRVDLKRSQMYPGWLVWIDGQGNTKYGKAPA